MLMFFDEFSETLKIELDKPRMHYIIKGVCFGTPPLNKFLNIDANKW
jgi:hypothetical protein